MKQRLNRSSRLPAHVAVPDYNPADYGVGIVHLGIGAFHRAHQAVYTDEAISRFGGDWRIAAVSLQNSTVAQALNNQQGLYSVLIRDDPDTRCRIVACIDQVIALRTTATEPVRVQQFNRMMQQLTAASTKIVSLTVTEKAYGIDRRSLQVDTTHSAISEDLAHAGQACGVIGILVHALKLRRKEGIEPFTVLCCDNLPENGKFVRSGVIDFARRIDEPLAAYIEMQVSFPGTMVDRITPASTDELITEVETVLGARDEGTVETEPFSQWVIEDRFPGGRPRWEAGGAQFVDNVAPYEMMKLRMLNGAHSLIAYAGYVAGFATVRDVMQSAEFVVLVRAHMMAAARTLPRLDAVNFDDYAASLVQRFSNRAIAHRTYQIAMDGTEKLPQRIFEPALHAIQHNQSIEAFAFAVAAWMAYCRGVNDNGEPHNLRDPREKEIVSALRAHENTACGVYQALSALTDFMPEQLVADTVWRTAVIRHLEVMLQQGMLAAITQQCDS
ncbi:hypothetical protein AB833_28370 [Chromatiales bacterium (ex Bugula neritina AB1)]|nr:hypothetical protein AB833_28370 [Chromatiales bacterium (ex Bugula neritina AB1)]